MEKDLYKKIVEAEVRVMLAESDLDKAYAALRVLVPTFDKKVDRVDWREVPR